jgi:hypothetical protein
MIQFCRAQSKPFPTCQGNAEFKAQDNTYRQQVYTVMRASYSQHYRRMTPLLCVLAVRRRAWGPLVAYPPLMPHIFFTEALNEICNSI